MQGANSKAEASAGGGEVSPASTTRVLHPCMANAAASRSTATPLAFTCGLDTRGTMVQPVRAKRRRRPSAWSAVQLPGLSSKSFMGCTDSEHAGWGLDGL